MKKMDEMDRDIQLRSEEWGYKTALLGLCAWTGFNIYQALVGGGKLEMLPCLILILSVSVQGFAQTAMKRNMIAGDEEYKEPNKLVQGVILAVVTVIVVLAVGVYFFQKDCMKNNIKQLRKSEGLRQEDMAKILGVSRQTIIAIENDKYNPTLELAMKIARLLRLHVEEIFILED